MARALARTSSMLRWTELRLLRGRTLAWALGAILALAALDYGLASYQGYTLEQRRQARTRLERAALFKLRADVQAVAFGPNRTYRLTVFLDNPFPEEPLYVMVPSIQAYVQVGTLWKEVPSRPGEAPEGTVVRLVERRTLDYLFEPDVKTFEENIPGFMHVRFENVMLVSQRSQPKDDLVERKDNYYIYLKPHGASDNELLKKNKFPEGKVPVWIPMPPH